MTRPPKLARRLPELVQRHVVAAVLLASLLVVPFRTGNAQSGPNTTAKQTSLGVVPADVAFYGTSLRNRETFEAFVNSRAFAKLKNLESVKTGLAEFEKQWNDPTSDFARVREVFERPETQESLAFVGDMFSHEWWSMGDMKHADLVELANGIGMALRSAQTEMQQDQANGNEPNPMKMVNAVIKALDENRDQIVIPNSITGFKVADKDRAAVQLAKLDALIQNAVNGNPTLQPNYSRQTIAGTEFLVLNLKGDMVPWQLAGFFLQGIDFASFNRVVTKLNSLRFTLALGLKDDQVLFLMGESPAYLETLGKGDLLYDRAEFAPLREHADKPLTSVAYVAEAYRKRVGNPGDAAAAIQQSVEQALSSVPLDEEIKAMIQKDLANIDEWMKTVAVEPGATLTFEFQTDRGYEGYAYDWSENVVLDGSKPLTLLEHVGNDPVGFFVARAKYRPEDYDNMVVVLTKIHGYVDTYLQKELGPEELAQYEKVMEIVEPQLKRLDDTTRNKLVPALKDGQGGIVFDMQETSRQWFTDMPPAQKPVAIPQLAFVYGVSDRKLLEAAMADYNDIVQKLLDDLHEFSPDEIPAIKIPAPRKETVEAGTVYEYEIPRDSGLDNQIAPTAGLSDKVAVWGYVPKQAKRILQPSPIADAPRSPLGTNDNLAAAGRFNHAAFVDGIEPWVEYGIQQFYASRAIGTAEPGDFVTFQDPPMEQVLTEVRAVADVLKCFRGYTGATTVEKGATVTHFEFQFQDLSN